MTENPVHSQALACARLGWPVFPCKPDRKTPATPNGYLDATTDPEQISRWFKDRPDRNIAVATGAPGPDVLDVGNHGPAGNGFAALDRLRDAGLLDGAAAQVRTPHGGLHFYFAGTSQRSARLTACHIDFLAAGGYVLIPPSTTGTIFAYQPYGTLHGRGTFDWAAAVRVLEPFRERQRAAARETSAAAASEHLDALAHWVSAQRAGTRNSALFWSANRVLEMDLAANLRPLAIAAWQAGLGWGEITRTLNSARRTSQASPQPPDHEAEGTS
jgi:hypothetical protein